jgi:PadR family transcriptional regulator, regulatory protein AphA
VSPSKKRRLGSRYAVLGMLSMGLKTGYAMKKHVAGNLGHYWSESYGQIYPTLRQLVAEGLATCTEERREGKPVRNLYAITRSGSKELREWLAVPPEPQPQRSELLLKLSLGDRVASATCQKLIRDHSQQCQRDLSYLSDIESSLRKPPQRHPDQPYWLMTLRHGRAIREAELAWCSETLAHLRRLAAAAKR